MQIGRLFEIVYILLNKKQVTAKELAVRFEVSVRTIFRDIDTLCEAGIPIYTSKGKGGGIGLMDGFILNKSVLSADERKEILSALQGLRATNTTDNQVLSKLSALFGTEEPDWIEIDFGGWGAASKQKFELIKNAILQHKVIQFEYYNAKMEHSKRRVDPIQLSFKDRVWYLKAYCHTKQQIRLFKLTRIKKLERTDEKSGKHCCQLPKEVSEGSRKASSMENVMIKVKIAESLAYRVYDEFEEDQITRTEDGSFIVQVDYPEDNWLYGYLLSYGPYLKVLGPKRVQNIIKDQLKKVLDQY